MKQNNERNKKPRKIAGGTTEGTFVCACVRRTMREVRESRDFSRTQS